MVPSMGARFQQVGPQGGVAGRAAVREQTSRERESDVGVLVVGAVGGDAVG